MSDTDNTLAELGLDLGTDTPVANQAEVGDVATTEEAKEKRTRKAVNVGEVVTGEEEEDLPTIARGFGERGEREKKYDFSDIQAPKSKGVVDGVEKFGYFTKSYAPGEGTEIEALDSSVKSAVSQANKAAREAGTNERYSTRAVTENGKQVAVKVYRVDLTTDLK